MDEKRLHANDNLDNIIHRFLILYEPDGRAIQGNISPRDIISGIARDDS